MQTPPIKLHPDLIRAWEKTVFQFAHKSTGKDLRDIVDRERENVRRLWQVFTEEREQIGSYLYDPKKQTVAYLLGFHLSNAARAVALCGRMDQRNFLFWQKALSKGKIAIYDFGCGTGAMSQALVQFLKNKRVDRERLQVNLIDSKGAFLDAAKVGLYDLGLEEGQVVTRKAEVDQRLLVKVPRAKDTTNIFVFGYFWNEIMRNKRLKSDLLKFFQGNLEAETLLLFVDSANQAIAREMMELRDTLVDMGYLAEFPCSHNLPCPMMERARDWCYSESAWLVPQEQKKIDKMMRLDRSILSSSSYVFSSPALPTGTVDRGKQVIVGAPQEKLHAKARARPKHFLLLCNNQGLTKNDKKFAREDLDLRGSYFEENTSATKR